MPRVADEREAGFAERTLHRRDITFLNIHQQQSS